jgi:short-subunit dehydrogenase
VALPEPSANSTALITGASSGIGEAIARELAARGQNLTLAARREEKLAALASELHDRHGVRAGVIACDLGEEDERARLEARISELDLDVEILVNNAGFGYAGKFVDGDRQRQVDMVKLNCEAVVDMTGRYLPAMVRRGRGGILNVASTGGFQPMPKSATYGASKAFVLSHSEAIHHELGGTGVHLTVLCPGPVRTEFSDAAGLNNANEKGPGFIWTSVEDVAREAVDGLASNKRTVVPGLLNQAGTYAGRYTPRWMLLPFASRIWQQVE